MPALDTGIIAPDFTLTTTEGQQVSLADALKKGPVLLAFFKTSCPVCQYAFPFFERAFQSNQSQSSQSRSNGGQSKDATEITVLGISQDTPQKTSSFLREYGVTFPVAIDDGTNGYAVSNAYGLTNVPTAFLIAPNGEIQVSSVGWSKRDVEAMNQRLAEYRKHPPEQLWRKGEDIPEYRAG